MDILIGIFVAIADFLLTLFAGDDVQKVSKFLKKKGLISFANGHSAACGCGFYKSTMDTVLEELNKRIVEMEENGEIERKEKQDILIDQIISFD